MRIVERIRWELQNPRSFLVLVLSLMVIGMFVVLTFETPTMEVSGRVAEVDENGNVILSGVSINKKLVGNEFEGYYIVLKVKYIQASVRGYNYFPFENTGIVGIQPWGVGK